MKPIFTVIFLIILFDYSYTQNFLTIFDGYNQDYNYNWRGIDNRQSLTFKNFFIEYAKQNGLLTDEFAIYSNNPKLGSVWNNLYVVDFNGDKNKDIIYSGSSGGESDIVKFFLQIDGNFQLTFTIYQGIVKVEWKDEKIIRIMTHDWGCCADFMVINKVYDVIYTNKIPKFEKIYQSIEYEFMKKPLDYFEEPIEFSVNNEVYKLRAFPEIDDTTLINNDFNEFRKGNTIGILSKGTKGIAYGKYIDETGRIWWYAEIKNGFEIEDNALYMDNLSYPTKVIGWISSRYVTHIK